MHWNVSVALGIHTDQRGHLNSFPHCMVAYHCSVLLIIVPDCLTLPVFPNSVSFPVAGILLPFTCFDLSLDTDYYVACHLVLPLPGH